MIDSSYFPSCTSLVTKTQRLQTTEIHECVLSIKIDSVMVNAMNFLLLSRQGMKGISSRERGLDFVLNSSNSDDMGDCTNEKYPTARLLPHVGCTGGSIKCSL